MYVYGFCTYFDFWLDNCCRFHLECPFYVHKYTHPDDRLQNKSLPLHSQSRSGQTGKLMATPLSFWCLYDLMRRNIKRVVCRFFSIKIKKFKFYATTYTVVYNLLCKRKYVTGAFYSLSQRTAITTFFSVMLIDPYELLVLLGRSI